MDPIGCPETSVRWVRSQKKEDLIYTAAETLHHAYECWKFCSGFHPELLRENVKILGRTAASVNEIWSGYPLNKLLVQIFPSELNYLMAA